MKCPICSALLPLGSDRCPDCGYRPRTTQAAPQPQKPSGFYTPPNPTKKPKGCCCCGLLLAIPAVILIAALIFGMASLVMEEIEGQIGGFDSFEDFPFLEEEPVPAPDAADEGCFAIRDGILTFIPDEWDGGHVLRVPETVAGETVTQIGPGCFRDCAELTTILLPDTVTVIGREAFAGCSELRGLYLPDGTETIGPDAFAGCIAMESIYVPSSILEVSDGAFEDCVSLLYLFYEGDFESWNAVCDDFINPFTTAICLDGNYYQGAGG